MRCPKCGYISFDHVETCLKCKKNIAGKVDINGTTYHVAAPSFLRFAQDDMEDEDDFEQGSDLDALAGDSDGFASEEDDVGENISFDSFESDDVAAEFQIEDEDDFELEAEAEGDDDGFAFDLEDEVEEGEEAGQAGLGVPEELSDISDLAPPVSAGGGEEVSLSLDDDTSVSEDADLDGMDFDLGIGGDDEDLSLSIDDIDLSEDELAGGDDIDGLSMDLDLGGLDDEDSSPKSKKSAGGLNDFDFSLD